MPEPRWQPRRWIWALWAGLPALVVLPFEVWLNWHAAVSEGGMLESIQGGLWILSIVSSVIVAVRLTDSRCRHFTLMLGAMGILAAAREFDLHVYLNPSHFGPWGVHYRIDWWFDRKIGLPVKLLWAAIFGGFALLVGYLVYRSFRWPDWRHARPRLLVGAALMYFVGFVCDDLLRGRINLDWAQLVEETSELIGATLYLGAVLTPESASMSIDEAKPRRPSA